MITEYPDFSLMRRIVHQAAGYPERLMHANGSPMREPQGGSLMFTQHELQNLVGATA